MDYLKKYLTTQEFANLLRISKHTLFYYDKIDLFKPAYVDEHGFRYYDVHQYDQLDTILFLRSIGLSIDEIKNYYPHKSIDTQSILIDNQIDKISKKIAYLKDMKKDLEITKCDLKEALTYLNKIVILDQDEEYLILGKSFNGPNFYSYTDQIQELLNSNKNISIESNLGCIYQKERALNGDYDYELTGYLKCIHKEKEAVIKPKGKYLVYFYKGRPSSLKNAYFEIKQYIEDNHLKTSDYFLEELIVGDWCASSKDDYISKISIQILE